MMDLERITEVLNEMYEYYDEDKLASNEIPTNKSVLCPYSAMGHEEVYDNE